MQAFTDLMAQHASYTYRASSAVSNELIAAFDKMSRRLRREMIAQLSEMSQRDLRDFVSGAYRLERSKALRDLINKEVAGFGSIMADTMDSTGQALAQYEADWMMKAVTSAAAGYEVAVLSGAKIYARAMDQPVVGYLFKETLQDVSDTTKRRVFAHLRTSMADGQTNQQVITDLPLLFGTQTMKYKDGGLNQTRTSIERIVRTMRTHVGSEAYSATYEALGVRRVVFRAQLDGRTSLQCAENDGQVFDTDKPHPSPPLHPNCRSQLAPYDEKFLVGKRPYVTVDKYDGKFRPAGKLSAKQKADLNYDAGQVSAKETYKSWFDKQDAAFQEDWLGPSRYKLYKEGGYTIDRFVDPLGAKYNLAELAAMDAKTFKQLGFNVK